MSGAQGPDAYDCWGLLRHVYRTQLGIELPLYPGVVPKDFASVARFITRELKSGTHWDEIKRPEHLCGVAMSSNNAYHHVGVWLKYDGGVILHSMDNHNVVVHPVTTLRAIGINNYLFYRFKQ